MALRVARLGLYALLLAALGPMCAQGAVRVQDIAAPAPEVGFGSYHPDGKFILYSPPAGVRHAGGVMSWVYNDANRPAGTPKTTAIASIQNAMAKWHAVCNIAFSYQGETTTSFGNDGVNVVGWDTTTMTIPTTGITFIAWSGPGAGGPFTFTDADIRLNANYNPNLDATTVHEVGHAIGLDHSNLTGQVMSNNPYTGFTTLQSDDIAGCQQLYGSPGGAPPTPDTVAPSVPTGLSATVVSSSAINLVWTASTDNVGVTGYKVFMNGSGTPLGTVASAGASVTGLAASTVYNFTVSACDAAANCSAQSALVSATTPAAGPPPDTQAPTVPAGLTATVASSSAINLAWTASTDNVAVTNYKVFLNGSGTPLGTVTATGASVTNLTASTMHSFTVSACDAAANCSAQSAPVSATTQAVAPPACAGPQPPNDQQTLACPAGQTGSIVQQRSYTCVAPNWTPGTFQNTSNTCTTPAPTASNAFSGNSVTGTGLINASMSGGGSSCSFTSATLYGPPGGSVPPHPQANIHFAQGLVDFTASGCSSGQITVRIVYPQALPAGTVYWKYGPTPDNTAAHWYVMPADISGNTVVFTIHDGGLGDDDLTVNGVIVDKGGPADAPTSYQGVWGGGPSESGWGLALTQHAQTLVAGWYYYDGAGRATWTIMPGCTWNTALTACTGALFNSTGAWFGNYSSAPFQQSNVGSATFTFTDVNNGTMSYVVNGVPGQKTISRLNFASGAAPSAIDYSDVWWGGTSQGGWGVALAQQQAVLVGSWYTYDSQGRAVWLVLNSGSWTSTTTYQGNLIRATSSPLLGTAYNSAAFQSTPAGPITINFSDANNASMTYTVDGVTQTKSISRLAF